MFREHMNDVKYW